MHLARDEHVLWQRMLHARGWGGPGWPKAFGGPGWSPVEQYIFEEECALGGAPRLIPFGLKMVAPVIMAFGNQAQQERFLPKILSAEEWWCQGYSEPGAGSDLASLSTRAVQARATTTSSTARRPGTRSASTPTGSSAWCAPIPEAKAAARHLLPAHRHEVARRHRAADHHPRRRARGQRDLVRGRRGAGGEPRRRGEQGLDLRQVPARPRAHQHRRHRHRQARAGAR